MVEWRRERVEGGRREEDDEKVGVQYTSVFVL
jgi:hypothetical protein